VRDRLISTTAGGATESYAFDGDGNRLTLSQEGQVTTSYVWDPNALLPELAIERDGAGAQLRRYTYGASIGQVPLAMRAGGSDHYLMPDSLGSLADVVSSDGTAEWSYTYEPYGAMRAAVQDSPSAPTNLLRFTGQLLDQTTSNYHLRARSYDPATGRFLQLDPVSQAIDDPFVADYVYVRDRPSVGTDPSGMTCLLFGLHYGDGGCVGGGVPDWVADHRWEVATVLAAAGCVASAGIGCAAITVTYVVGQSAVLYEDGDERLTWAFVLNSLCGAGKSVAGAAVGFPIEGTVGLLTSDAGGWYASPGCWQVNGVGAVAK
jgi:RHS repeat-associated protein